MAAPRTVRAAPRSTLFIGLFGKPRFSVGAEPWRFSAPPRTLPLLAYLILHRATPVLREVAAFALWPDEDESTARTNLRRHLHYLQSTLPGAPPSRPWILHDGRTVIRWNPDAACRIDVAEFERLSCGASLAAAVELYGGSVLEDVIDDWIVYDRERLRDLQMSNLHKLSLTARRDGDLAGALRFAQRLLALDPWREDAVRQTLELRYAMGDRAGALAEFERFSVRLQDELSATPMAETQVCYESILRNAPVLHAPQSATPPALGVVDAALRKSVLPFVGRDAELEVLRVWWTRTARGSGNVGFVAGEAGIGKSRLLAELEHVVESDGGRVVVGGTTANEALPYQPVVEALRGALAMLPTLKIDRIWLAVVAGLLPELSGSRPEFAAAPAVESGQERARLFEAIFQVLRGLAEQRPTLLILEDLHWTGSATVDLIDYLAHRITTTRLLIVASYRDDEVVRVHPLRKLRRKLAQGPRNAHLTLSPIGLPAVEALVAKLAGRVPLVRDCAALLHARSEGSPLFLAQLITTAAEQGSVVSMSDTSSSGLREIIGARLARLSDDARSLALMAAVVGTAFDVEILREVTGWSDDRTMTGLDELLDRRLIRDGGLKVSGDYTFSHHAIEAAAYAEASSSRDLKRRHQRIAAVMEELYADRLDDVAYNIARHFEQSNSPARAAAYYARAARFASSVFAYDDAVARATRGLELAADNRVTIELLFARDDAHARRGDAPAREADLDALETLVSVEDLETRCEVVRRRIDFYHFTDRRMAEAAAIRDLETLAKSSHDSHMIVEALYAKGRYLLVVTRFVDALDACEEALTIAAEATDARAQARCHSLIAEICAVSGDYPKGAESLAAAARHSDAVDDPALQLQVLNSSCFLANFQSRNADLTGFGLRALELARAVGDRYAEVRACNYLGTAAGFRFDLAEARRYYVRAEEIADSLRQTRLVLSARFNQCRLELMIGRNDEALERARGVKAMATAVGVHLFVELATLMIPDALARKGDKEQAYIAARESVEITSQSNSYYYPYALMKLAEIELDRGDAAVAIEHAKRSIALWDSSAAEVDVAEAMATLSLLYFRARMLDEASTAMQSFLPLLTAEAQRFQEPEAVYWTAAQVCHAKGDEGNAHDYLARAWSIYRDRIAQIPDDASRAAYASLSFHRELEAAHEHGRWEAAVPVLPHDLLTDKR